MAKSRYIHTKFWSDNFITTLDPLERYLFLYFLTNEHTNIAGIYELAMRVMAFESGIDEKTLKQMIARFAGKIYYIDGWVYVKNFEKNQVANESVKKGIERTKAEIPKEILAKIATLETETPQTPPREGGRPDILKPKLKPKLKPYNRIKMQPQKNSEVAEGKEIAEIIDLFKTINPAYQRLFGNKTQRESVKRLLTKMTRKQLEGAIAYAAQSNSKPYAPTITTPYELETKFGKLMAFYQKEKGKDEGNKVINLT